MASALISNSPALMAIGHQRGLHSGAIPLGVAPPALRAEGLSDVVVRAHLQTKDAVGFGGFCRQKTMGYRPGRAGLPNPPAEIKPITAGTMMSSTSTKGVLFARP